MRNKQLAFSVSLKDCEVETFRAGGKGGQHQNKTDSAVRIRHRPSGAVAECREERSQLANKKRAFGKMARSPEMAKWIRMELAKANGMDAAIEEEVRRLMRPGNILTEVKDEEGKWVKEDKPNGPVG